MYLELLDDASPLAQRESSHEQVTAPYNIMKN